ncbi:MAG: hypothetical protein ACFWT2_11375 [Thermoanaerobacterium thermosaccharolyticum]
MESYSNFKIRNIITYLFIIVVLSLSFLVTLNMNINITLNIIYFFILLIISTFILIIGNFLFKEINNPINLFFIGWLLPLTLSQLHLSRLQKDFSSSTWLLIVLSSIAFLVPTFINGINLKKAEGKDKVINKNLNYNVNGLYKPIFYIGLLIIFVMLINWKVLGGIPLLAGEANISHLDNAKFTSYFIFFSPYLSGLSIFYMIMKGKKYRKFIWLFILLPYIYSILQMLRSFMLSTIFSQICFIYLAYRVKGINVSYIVKKLYKYVIFGFSTLIVIMVVLGNIRLQSMAGSTKLSSHFWANALGFYSNNEALAWFYSYYVMGFDNLNYFINNYHGPYMYGYNVLLPIIGPLQIKNFWYIDPNYIDSIIPRLWGGAVATYLREIYLDGGLIFTVIIVFLFSIFVNYIYRKSVEMGIKINWFSVYIVISYGIFYMFFNSGAIFQPNVIIFMILIYYITNSYIRMEVSNENSDKCVNS